MNSVLSISDPLLVNISLLFSDNIDVDIVGANLYQKYIDAYHNNSNGDDNNNTDSYTIPACRHPPESTEDILPATVKKVHSVLVRTGVSTDSTTDNVDKCHREFTGLEKTLRTPTATTDDILQAVEFIMLEENIV